MNFKPHMRLAQEVRGLKIPTSCVRGSVGAVLFNATGESLALGKNGLPECLAPCKCNDGADTHTHGSSTCKAVHAEVAAVLSVGYRISEATLIATTRPPCRTCLSVLFMSTEITTIVTTNEYPDRDNSRIEWEKAGKDWHVLDYEPATDLS